MNTSKTQTVESKTSSVESKETDECIPYLLRVRPSGPSTEPSNNSSVLAQFMASVRNMMDGKQAQTTHRQIVEDAQLTSDEKKEMGNIVDEMARMTPQVAALVIELRPDIHNLNDILHERDEISGEELVNLCMDIATAENLGRIKALLDVVITLMDRTRKVRQAVEARGRGISEVKSQTERSWLQYIGFTLFGAVSGLTLAISAGTAAPVLVAAAGAAGALIGSGYAWQTDGNWNPENIDVTTLIRQFEDSVVTLQRIGDDLDQMQRGMGETHTRLKMLKQRMAMKLGTVNGRTLSSFRTISDSLRTAIDDLANVCGVCTRP